MTECQLYYIIETTFFVYVSVNDKYSSKNGTILFL